MPDYLPTLPGTYATFPDFNEYLQQVNINSKEFLVQEVGQSGTLNFGGFLDTDEWVGNLKNYTLYKTIDYMRTDAIVAAIERGNTRPIEQARAHFNYDDPAAIKDPKYKFHLDFIEKDFANLNQQFFLHNACMFKPYGFSTFEEIFEESNYDNYLHITRLAPRQPKTAFRWLTDHYGNLTWFIQLVYTPGPNGENGAWEYKSIPAEKILLITNEKEGGNFAGRSAYRPFYREWLTKDNAIKQLAITVNRVGGGIPIALINKEAPESSSNTSGGNTTDNLSVQRQVEQAFKKLQGGENSYFAGKWIDKLEMFGLNPGAITSIMETIKYCDESMIKAAYQPQLSLGTSATGSRSLGETFENMYYEMLRGDCASIESAVNEQVIKRIIDMNFGTQECYPKLKLELKPDMAVIALTLKNMKMAGLIEGNRDLENVVLKFYGLPETTSENNYHPMDVSKKAATATPDTDDINVPEDNGQSEETTLSEKRRNIHKHIKKVVTASETGLNRVPNAREIKLINFSETISGLKSITSSFKRELRQIVEPIMKNMAHQLGQGTKIYKIKPDFGNRVADLYRKYFKELKNQAAADVRKEIQKQDKKINLSEIALANKPVNKKNNYDAYSDEQSNIDSLFLENETNKAMLEYYDAATKQGLVGERLSEYIIAQILDEEGQRYETAADDITSGYSLAREMSADELSSVIKTKIRSEVFDKNICANCEAEDGAEYYQADDGEYYDEAGEPAPDLTVPQEGDSDPIHCIGARYGNDCRGIYLYEV